MMQSTTATVAQEAALLERKIALATEGFTTKFCELVLKDRNRMSQENALVLAEYIVAMKREVNPRLSYIRYTIQFLSELSKAIDKNKPFKDMTDIDIFHYLDSARKPETQDPLHKWIGTYNTKRMTLMRFFKWLYYPGVASPEERNKLSSSEKKPACIMGLPKLRRKEKSCYKPSDLWSQEDDLLFLKWVTNKRNRCYHTMSRDLSARPHEILGLKIKDVAFKTTGKVQYAEVLVNGKTGSAMAQKYLHYFGNESSDSLLEAYGIVTKDNISIDTLNPKTCPNCSEGNTQDSKFCNKCRMVLTYDAYSDTLESEKHKQSEVDSMREELASFKESQQEILDLLKDPKQLLKLIESE
jgi:hypothetical protein